MVTVTEAGGTTVSQTVTITVKNLNEAPMVTGGVTMKKHAEDDADIDTDTTTAAEVGTYTATDPETTVATDLTWTVGGRRQGQVRNFSNGELTFKDAPNYEMPADAGRNNVYNVTVVVTDDGVDGKNEMTAMREVVIMVTNEEEDGDGNPVVRAAEVRGCADGYVERP